MIYIGEIKDAINLSIEEEPLIKFIYGTIVYDLSGRFDPGDWIATSQIIELAAVDNGFAGITQNSIYYIEEFERMVVPWAAVSNIRLGTPPVIAVKLLSGM